MQILLLESCYDLVHYSSKIFQNRYRYIDNWKAKILALLIDMGYDEGNNVE
jgi:hypothetical protein